jgi:hypothetical protein
MVVAFGLESGLCRIDFLCCNRFMSGIDYYTRHKVFGLLSVDSIHSIIGHCTCSIFATPGVYGTSM